MGGTSGTSVLPLLSVHSLNYPYFIFYFRNCWDMWCGRLRDLQNLHHLFSKHNLHCATERRSQIQNPTILEILTDKVIKITCFPHAPNFNNTGMLIHYRANLLPCPSDNDNFQLFQSISQLSFPCSMVGMTRMTKTIIFHIVAQ